MNNTNDQAAVIKSALFVDFDNIYLGLKRENSIAAESFATDPARWIAWMEAGMSDVDDKSTQEMRRRALLVRRCYLNPTTEFSNFCANFTCAGFSVMACAPLAKGKKNSADFHMIMDILDTIDHRTHFDEFIILSSDSDFAPVLLRLREYGRRTTVLTAGAAASAYKHACDNPISPKLFVGALCTTAEKVRKRIAKRLYEAVTKLGEISASNLPLVFRMFPEFSSSNDWLGFGSLRRFTEDLVRLQAGLRLVEGDPWKVTVASRLREVQTQEATGEPSRTREPSSPFQVQQADGNGRSNGAALDSVHKSAPSSGTPGDEKPSRSPDPHVTDGNRRINEDASRTTSILSDADLLDTMIVQIQQIVAQSPAAVPLATVAAKLGQTVGKQAKARWDAEGGFRKFLQNTSIPGVVAITGTGSQEYVYDPARHTLPPRKETAEKPPIPANARSVNGQAAIEPSVLAPRSVAAPLVPLPRTEAPQKPPESIAAHDESLQVVAGPSVPAAAIASVTKAQREEMPQDLPFAVDTLEDLIRKVYRATETPRLTSEEYAVVFHAIADELQQGSYDPNSTPHLVQQRCFDQGVAILRANVAFILEGMIRAGYELGTVSGGNMALELAKSFRNVVAMRCYHLNLELTDNEYSLIDDWILGAISAEEKSQGVLPPSPED